MRLGSTSSARGKDPLPLMAPSTSKSASSSSAAVWPGWCDDQAGRGGRPVDLFSMVPVKRSHSVCAQGGINGATNTASRATASGMHFDDTVYGGDFLQNQPPVKEMCDGRRRSSTCWTAWACRSTARRGPSTSAASAARCSSARPSPARPPASNCSTRSTSRSPLGGRRGGEEVRVLGFPLADPRRRRCAGASSRRTCGRWRSARSAATPWSGDRRRGLIFGALDDVDHLHRRRRVAALLPAGARLRQRRVHPGPPDRHPRRGQACG